VKIANSDLQTSQSVSYLKYTTYVLPEAQAHDGTLGESPAAIPVFE